MADEPRSLPHQSHRDPSRDVRSTAILDERGSCRGWVRLDADRVGHANQTEYAITIDTTSYLSPFEARAFAHALLDTANEVDRMMVGV